MQARADQQLQRVCAGSVCVHVLYACVERVYMCGHVCRGVFACVRACVCARMHVRVCPCSHTPANRLQSGLCTVPQGIKSVCTGRHWLDALWDSADAWLSKRWELVVGAHPAC